jgi:hypothetical protein
MSDNFTFKVDKDVAYDYTLRRRGNKPIFDINQIEHGSSIFVKDTVERARITASFSYYSKKYPDLYGYLVIRGVPEDGGYRMFFLDKSKV